MSWLEPIVQRAHEALSTPLGDAARAFLTSRGVTAQQIRDYQIGLAHPDVPIGVCAESFMPWVRQCWHHALLFPLRSPLGSLTGVQSRAVDEKYYRPYYLLPAQVYPQLFGIHRTIEAIWTTRHAVIVEGVLDFLAIEPYVPTAVSVLTAHVPRPAKRFLNRYADTLTVLLDMDATGRDAARRLVEQHVCRYIRVPVYPAHDPSDLVRDGRSQILCRLTRDPLHLPC